MIADSVVAEGYKTYKSLYGCYPPTDVDVTHEQLIGLWTLLESKKTSAPLSLVKVLQTSEAGGPTVYEGWVERLTVKGCRDAGPSL
eukprot:3313984-Amphidinium_carterae.2